MKKHLSKSLLVGLATVLLVVLPLSNLSAQVVGNVVTGGTMEEADSDSWNVDIVFQDDFNDIPEYLFGSDEGCVECVGNGLKVWAAGEGHTNIIFWQKVTLKANHVYRANAAFASLNTEAKNNWVQLKITIDAFPQNENDGLKLLGTNFWQSCGATEDGLFQTIACDGFQAGETGHGYLAPDTVAEFEAFFSIVAGMWTDQQTADILPYEFLIDEVVLIDSTEASSVSVEPNMSNEKASLMNFPNPFKQKTTILYDIPSRSNVRLTVYNLQGQEIANLYEGVREAGAYRAELDLSGFDNNLLICKLEYNKQVIFRKMTMLK